MTINPPNGADFFKVHVTSVEHRGSYRLYCHISTPSKKIIVHNDPFTLDFSSDNLGGFSQDFSFAYDEPGTYPMVCMHRKYR